MVELNLNR
jgi:hypothetical protein